MTSLSRFLEQHFFHFNARETIRAAQAFRDHLDSGGKMLLAIAGAMSTGELGGILARLIRAGGVHAVSCTGANLEEDLFSLFSGGEYTPINSWRDLSPQDELSLFESGLNRVTDTCIPETVMRLIETYLLEQWKLAASTDVRRSPAEYLFQILDEKVLNDSPEVDFSRSWVVAAKEMGIPVFVPGWEDSSSGNVFAACVMKGELPDHTCVKTGTEQFEELMRWYLRHQGEEGSPGVGFFQIGGGIAGDFAICAVPCLVQDLGLEARHWAYFAQITDAVASYGGYSGAPPNEKITWGKLSPDTPRFTINSDASIVAPLIFGYVLGD